MQSLLGPSSCPDGASHERQLCSGESAVLPLIPGLAVPLDIFFSMACAYRENRTLRSSWLSQMSNTATEKYQYDDDVGMLDTVRYVKDVVTHQIALLSHVISIENRSKPATYSMGIPDTSEQVTIDNWGRRQSTRNIIRPTTRHVLDPQHTASVKVCPRTTVSAPQSTSGLRQRNSTCVNVYLFPSTTESPWSCVSLQSW